MAAPSVSGFLTLRNINFLGDGTNISIDNGGIVTIINAAQLQFRNITAGQTYNIRIGFNEAGTLDFTDKDLYISWLANLNIGNNTLRLGAYSASGSRTYPIQTSEQYKFRTNNYLLSLKSGPFTDVGTFDITAVQGLQIVWHSNVTLTANDGNRGGVTFYRFQYLNSKGITLSDGEPGNQANIDDLISYLTTMNFTIDIPYGLLRQLNNEFIAFPANLTLADGGALNFGTNGGAIVAQANATTANASWLVYESRTLTVKTVSSQVFNFQIKGFDFVEESTVANLYRDIPINGYTEALLGNSDYLRVEFVGSGAAIGGHSLESCTFPDSTATYAYQWNGTATVECEFSGTQDFFINFEGTDFADGATFDATGITFSGTPGTNIFRLDAAGKTLNILVDPDSGLTSSDVTVVAGTVNVENLTTSTVFSGFPTTNNANGVTPSPVIGFYSSASAAGFIAGLDTSDPEYSAGSFTVFLSDYPGVTHVVGDAVGWIRTDYIPVDADNPPSSLSLSAAFREILSESGESLVGNGTVDGKAKLTYDQANTRFEVAAGPITFADTLDKKEELTSNVAGLEDFETAVVRGIQFISSKYGNEILLPDPLTIAAAEDAATSPILENFLVVRAGDPTEDPFEHGLSSTASGLTDRPEVRMISTLFISGSSGGGATIDAQDVADALKLAPTAGSPAAGSVYAELDSLLTGTGGTLSYDLPQFIALMRTDEAFKRALSEGSLIPVLADELALVKTQVWTRSDVRTAWNVLITNAGVTEPSTGEVAVWNGYTSLLSGLSFASNGEVSYAG